MPLRDLIRGEMSPSSGETLPLRLRPCLLLSLCQKKQTNPDTKITADWTLLTLDYLLHLTQMLQLRRPGPPRQGVQVASAAEEVPFLPEHWPHGCQLPNQSTAVLAGFSGKAVSLQRRRRRAWPPGGALRQLWLGGKVGTPGEAEANQTASMERWEITTPVHPSRLLLELPQVKTVVLLVFFAHEEVFWLFVCHLV